ncbi:MAG: transcriptional regulator FtrA [Granulosicoccus sp.]
MLTALVSNKKQSPPEPGLVVVLAYDGLCTFEFGIAVEIFGLARPEFDFPWYRFAVASAENRRIRATGGVVVEVDAGLELLASANTIVIPGWRDRNEHPPDAVLSAIANSVEAGARCLTICSGVFVLAATGLLDGKRATTHWRHIPTLQHLYPAIHVEHDALYVDEGALLTSAGSAAGIDACVHLIRRDYDTRVANAVARRLVMQPYREGGQKQYVSKPIPTTTGHEISAVMAWARQHLSNTIKLSDMAQRAATSERTFYRRFQQTIGTTPVRWLRQERINRAQELLETGDRALIDIANQCGYESLETFRVVFRKLTGIAPAAYRARFRATTTTFR